MQSSLEKLRKFFRLEHENGYSNTAIIGGLAKMLDFWEAEARVDGINEEVIQAVEQRLRSYDGLSPQSRADALKGLWKRIGETYPKPPRDHSKDRNHNLGRDLRRHPNQRENNPILAAKLNHLNDQHPPIWGERDRKARKAGAPNRVPPAPAYPNGSRRQNTAKRLPRWMRP